MEIFVKKTQTTTQKRKERPAKKVTAKKSKERRQATQDRRHGANQGVIVSLSTRKEKRLIRERRRLASLEILPMKKEKKQEKPQGSSSLLDAIA
ncbi:MAG: hypothetical protein KAI75_01735 [Desulfobulbaceae bacterium]|nr:hypothetical protein [Desulfobulbaceae bacterium]